MYICVYFRRDPIYAPDLKGEREMPSPHRPIGAVLYLWAYFPPLIFPGCHLTGGLCPHLLVVGREDREDIPQEKAEVDILQEGGVAPKMFCPGLTS